MQIDPSLQIFGKDCTQDGMKNESREKFACIQFALHV